jgi:hypothetical protein
LSFKEDCRVKILYIHTAVFIFTNRYGKNIFRESVSSCAAWIKRGFALRSLTQDILLFNKEIVLLGYRNVSHYSIIYDANL